MTQEQAWDKVAAAQVIQDCLSCGSPILENEEFLIEIVVCISVKYHFPSKLQQTNKNSMIKGVAWARATKVITTKQWF